LPELPEHCCGCSLKFVVKNTASTPISSFMKHKPTDHHGIGCKTPVSQNGNDRFCKQRSAKFLIWHLTW
jgi:hypothetical protein